MPYSSELRAFGAQDFDRLSREAQASTRRRQHHNLHANWHDPCQRLFNAIGIESYIRPHRHLADPKIETLIAVSGDFALLAFDDAGQITRVIRFGTSGDAVVLELPPDVWHSVVALSPDAVLLEVKPGPFDPTAAKELAMWAPVEGSDAAIDYLHFLHTEVRLRT